MEWGLNAGAEVSDNGVCRLLPIDAVFVHYSECQQSIPSDMFPRILHPSNVNRPIITCSYPCSDADFPPGYSPLPLHILLDYGYEDSLIIHLLNAGARIDICDYQNKLPMILYSEHFRCDVDPYTFSCLIPKSVGISPTLFIDLLFIWNDLRNMEERKLVKSIFCQHLMLSSGWQNLRVHQRHSSGSFTIYNEQYYQAMCLCGFHSLIDFFTECGIGAKYMTSYCDDSFQPKSSNNVCACMYADNVNEAQDKWNKYMTLIPSLSLQCVRVIRSALQVVTEESLHKLPIPKSLHTFISLEQQIDEVCNKFHMNS